MAISECKTNRIAYIDLFKAIGILYMIMGHIGFGDTFSIYIHGFHMPMFFFISGYLYKYYDLKKFIKRKFDSLIIPYLSFGILNLILVLLLQVPNFKINRFLEIFFFFNNKGIPVAGALWFLTCLFFINIIFYFLEKSYYKNKAFLPLSIMFLVTVEYFFKIRLPFSIDSAIYMLPVFYSGYLFKKYEIKFNNIINLILSIVLLIGTYFLILKNGMVNVRLNNYSCIILFYITTVLCTLGYFYLSKILGSEFFNKNTIYEKISNCFRYIGTNSLWFLALNHIYIYIYIYIYSGQTTV